MSFFTPRYNTIVNVQNFGEDTTNEKLYDMFSKFGTIKSYKLMINPYAECQNFAYVAFEDSDAAEDAIIELNGQKINDDFDSPRLKVRRTHKKHPSQPKLMMKRENVKKVEKEPEKPNNGLEIFVKNLEEFVDTENLRRIFGRYGTITSAKIIKENGYSKGYGFVAFTTPEAASNAVREKNGRILGTKYLHVAIARGKNISKDRSVFTSQRESHTSFMRGMRYGEDVHGLLQHRRVLEERLRERSDDFREFRNMLYNQLN